MMCSIPDLPMGETYEKIFFLDCPCHYNQRGIYCSKEGVWTCLIDTEGEAGSAIVLWKKFRP